MYRSTAIQSNWNREFTALSFDETYLGASDLDRAGLGIQEYYFICDNDKDVVGKKLLDIHDKFENVDQDSDHVKLTATTSYIEDPVLTSSNKKYLFFLREPLGHFLLHNLALIINIHKLDKNATFVIFTGSPDFSPKEWEETQRKKLLDFLTDFFSSLGIAYYFVKSNFYSYNFSMYNNGSAVFDAPDIRPISDRVVNYPVYKVKNVDVVDSVDSTSKLTLRDIATYIEEYVCSRYGVHQHGHKKIYLSRGFTGSEVEPIIESGDSVAYKSGSVRIYEEDLVEEFLKLKGFEVYKPDQLSSIEDQIRVMLSASVLIGATGTGLINMLFMPRGGVVVEFRVELGSGWDDNRLVAEYFEFSVAKNHLYIGVDLPDKQGKTAVEKLDILLNRLDLDGLMADKKKDLQ